MKTPRAKPGDWVVWSYHVQGLNPTCSQVLGLCFLGAGDCLYQFTDDKAVNDYFVLINLTTGINFTNTPQDE